MTYRTRDELTDAYYQAMDMSTDELLAWGSELDRDDPIADLIHAELQARFNVAMRMAEEIE